ncbi:MAG: hypothetical protein V7651_15105 [Hyphomonas oceanitis]|uniref:hypothetical protein n=1 Tax=Hyphomonas oceanitis TaxID=81033 RepID=UPI0030031BA7
MRKLKTTGLMLAGLLMLAACGENSSAEKQGEKMDSAIEEATTGEVDRTDGPLENAGEAVDDAADEASDPE